MSVLGETDKKAAASGGVSSRATFGGDDIDVISLTSNDMVGRRGITFRSDDLVRGDPSEKPRKGKQSRRRADLVSLRRLLMRRR